MAELQLYDKLLQFPLFLGMSHNDIMEMVAHTRLDFFKLEAGKSVVKADSICDKIIMLVSGQVEATTLSADRGYTVEEVFNSPYTLQPENLFGTSQRFRSSFTTSTKCNFISIDKHEMTVLFSKFATIRINYLNSLANITSKAIRHTWMVQGDDNRQRIVNFMITHCLRPSGHKTYKMLMTRLAMEINASRLEVSIELNKMESEGLLKLSRGRITVPFLERLTTL